MFKIIEAIFGVVVANKLRMLVGDTKRNPFVSIGKAFLEGYTIWFKTSDDKVKFYLIIAPFFNLFVFSGFFAFVLIMASNFYIFKKCLSR